MNTATPPMSARTRAVCYAVLGTIVVMALLANQSLLPVGITWNRTASLPIGLYWHSNVTATPAVGDTVCFPYKAPDWARPRLYFSEGALLCKRVLGLPGDRIVHGDGRFEVCHANRCTDAGEVKTHDSMGRSAVAAQLPDVIPEGFVYMGIPEVPMSFDSRYLGLIALADLERTIHPVWVWAGK